MPSWQPNFDWVTDHLAVGGSFPVRQTERLTREHGIRAVIDLRNEDVDDERLLRAHGIAVVPHAFADHHAYTAADFEFGSRLPVLMTEKDAVKCRTLVAPEHMETQFHSVPVRAELPEAFWIALLDKLPPRGAHA